MKTAILTMLALILTISLTFAQTDCQKAYERARYDFKKSNFAFHSEEILPIDNAYFYVLSKYYNINWYFTDSLNYYNCYDSVMIALLKRKYGVNFLKNAHQKADSLENSLNWRKEPQFPGGEKKLFAFLSTHLNKESIKIESKVNKNHLYAQIDIDKNGKVSNPKLWGKVDKIIGKKVIDVIKRMPNWEPAYQYGKPIKISYMIPINIVYK
jgi:hypothetical protein